MILLFVAVVRADTAVVQLTATFYMYGNRQILSTELVGKLILPHDYLNSFVLQKQSRYDLLTYQLGQPRF